MRVWRKKEQKGRLENKLFWLIGHRSLSKGPACDRHREEGRVMTDEWAYEFTFIVICRARTTMK